MDRKVTLELAAKGAGIKGVYFNDGVRDGINVGTDELCVLWRPLDLPYDAMNLAATIRPDIICLTRSVRAAALAPYFGIKSITVVCEDTVESRAKAMHEAITLLAAEIGKTIP